MPKQRTPLDYPRSGGPGACPCSPVSTHSVRVVPMLPDLEREKEYALREDLERQKKGLRFWTPGSEQWIKTCEEIARLEALLALPHG